MIFYDERFCEPKISTASPKLYGMSSQSGTHSTNPRRVKQGSSQTALIIWLSGGAAILIAFVVGFFILNSTVYSPKGLVKSYLETIGKSDAESAKQFPGIELEPASAALMNNNALNEIRGITIDSEEDAGDDLKLVTASYTLLSHDGDEQQGTTEFLVKKQGSVFGVFENWAFAENPTATVTVSVENDWRFSLNQENISLPDGVANAPQSVEVLVPNLYEIGHTSNYFTAETQTYLVGEIGHNHQIQLQLRPTDEFVDLISTEINSYLDECATQHVLQPTNCPFGKHLTDTVVDEPEWSIVEYPEIYFESSDDGWMVPPVEAVANLHVTMSSLFDGQEYVFDEEVPFMISYTIVPDENGNFRIIEKLV